MQWAFISIATASLAHFLLRIILGRELGPEGLGLYTLAFTVYLFGMQFAAFGIGSALTKFIAEHIDDQNTIRTYVSSGMSSSIITGTLMGAVLFILSPFIAVSFFHIPKLESLLQITALCCPFIAIQKAVLGTLNGFRKMHLYAFLNIIQNVMVVALSIALVYMFDMDIVGAVIGFVASTILVSALCPILIRESIDLDRTSSWNAPALRATTSFGFFIVLGNSINFLNTQINSILIGAYMGPTEVGIFAVAILFAQALTLIPNAIQRVTAPVMATLYGKGDVEGVKRLYYSTLHKSFLLTISCAAIIAVVAPFLISIMFSEEYLASYAPLLILLMGHSLSASFSAVGSTLSSIGKVHIPFRIGAICAALNVILNILLIPYLGMNGAAIATTATMIASFIITVIVIRNLI